MDPYVQQTLASIGHGVQIPISVTLPHKHLQPPSWFFPYPLAHDNNNYLLC